MNSDSSDRNLRAWADNLRAQGKSECTIAAYVSDVQRYGGHWGSTTAGRALRIRESGLGLRTISRHLASHASFARFMGNTDALSLFARRPSMGVVLPAVVPEVEQMRRFVAAEPDPMWRALWAVMCGEGLRLSEAAGLTWDRVNIDTKNIRVIGKGMKMRDVPMSTAVRDHLLTWRKLSPEDALIVFPISRRTIQRHVKENAVRAGLSESWHPHALRHGFATATLEATGNVRVTGDLLGHSSLSTTMIYTHVRGEHRRAAVEAVL